MFMAHDYPGHNMKNVHGALFVLDSIMRTGWYAQEILSLSGALKISSQMPKGEVHGIQ
jgi:hypothetical protein